MTAAHDARSRIVLGVDPSFVAAGFGIVQVTGNVTRLIEAGVLTMSSKETLAARISQFHLFFQGKIKEHGVMTLALETPFLGKNPQNFLKLGYLRGILYLLQHTYELGLHEFAPSEVKRGITGFGGADKEQVARVVMRLFPAISSPKSYDLTDAVAVALCGAWQR